MLKKIITQDKTETYHNETIGESYHSHTGAVQEAILKYAIPCKIREKAKSGKLVILDMFFGLGYNSAMAISEALDENPDCLIEVIGVEFDPAIVNNIQHVNPPISFYSHYKKLSSTNLQFTHNNVTVKLLLGDAREIVPTISAKFDAIFYDPFSPKNSPEMWSVDLFSHMYRNLHETGILATYSCARLVRDNLSEAGFLYDDGPKVHRRGPGTIARRFDLKLL